MATRGGVGQHWNTNPEDPTATREQPPEEFLEAEKTAEWFFAAFRDEDYTAQTDVQNGLASLADKHMIIGRNEIAVQHAQETINRLLAGEPVNRSGC